MVYSKIGMGMGLMFTSAEPGHLRLLEEWIAELSGNTGEEASTPHVEIDASALDNSRELEPQASERDQSKLEPALLVSHARVHATLDCVADAVIFTNSSGKVTFLNAAAEQMTGWVQAEASRRPLARDQRNHRMFTTTQTMIPDYVSTAEGQSAVHPLPPNCHLLRRDGESQHPSRAAWLL